MDKHSEEFKVTEDLFSRNIRHIAVVEERLASAFATKYENDPDWKTNEECSAHMHSAEAMLQAGKRAEAMSWMAQGSLCFGKFFRSKHYSKALECMSKNKSNPEPCGEVLADMMDDVMQARERASLDNLSPKALEVQLGINRASEEIVKKRYDEDEVNLSLSAFVLKNYCPTTFSKLIQCSKTFGGDTTKCPADVEKTAECYIGFQLEGVLAMMRPPKK